HRSTDAGSSYPFHNSLGGNEVAAIAIDPANASKIYLGDAGHAFANFIVRSDDAGASIAQTLLSPEGQHAKTIAIDPNRKNTIWVGISSDLWLTADGGLNWRHMSLGGTVNKITFDPDATKTALVSTDAGLYKVRNWIVTKLLSTGVAGAFFNPVGSGEIF